MTLFHLNKHKRKRNPQLITAVKALPCVISGALEVDVHHVKSVGSGGSDVEWNLCPLRHDLHQEFHKIGCSSFAEKYPRFKEWLLENNWNKNEYNKWKHEGE